MRPVAFDLLGHQDDFVYSESKHPALVAGYGSGKTTAFVLKGIVECGLNPGKQVLLAEPVYPMVKDVLQPTLEKVLHDIGYSFHYSAGDMKYRIVWADGYADNLLRSAENYRRWAGLNLASFGIDEADLLKDNSAWMMGLSRLRDGNTLRGFASSTPEGFSWMWEMWSESPTEGYELIRGKTSDNTYLPDEFIESLKQNYDEKLLKAYMYGEFVNLQKGQTYYTFQRERNIDERVQYHKELPIVAGMDFNCDPCCAVLWQKHNTQPYVRVFDEVSLHHTQGELLTERMAREIKNRYPNNQYIVVPDPAGKARSTNARRSDHQILRDEGLDVRSDRRHPPVVDRVNTVNKRLESIAIHPKCKSLIRDFEQVVNKDGTREIDKSNSKLTHMTDAFGYSLVRFYPLQQVNVRAMQR